MFGTEDICFGQRLLQTDDSRLPLVNEDVVNKDNTANTAQNEKEKDFSCGTNITMYDNKAEENVPRLCCFWEEQ